MNMPNTQRSNTAWILFLMLVCLVALGALGLSIKNTIDMKRQAVSLATLQLRSVVLSAQPFKLELDQLRVIAGNQTDLKPLLAALEKTSATGIPSARQLFLDFQTAAAASLIAEQERPSLGVLNDLASRVAATAVAVSMEAGLNPFDSEVSPYVLQAQTALQNGDIQKAVEIVSQLSPEASVAFADWLTSARGLLETRDALDKATNLMLKTSG
ncbi:mitofilin family membrane protein [Aestuariivirga sp.]|jgi:hypothetical protein|uniref:mitofilin family membrane protein n=1 Tax=Aestuariivirga sp. TaxID=2650926 RepID=UPI003783B08D